MSLLASLVCVFVLRLRQPLTSTLFPYTTLFRSDRGAQERKRARVLGGYHQLAGRLAVPGAARRDLQDARRPAGDRLHQDRKSTRLNSSHVEISYAVFCLKKKKYRLRSNE